MPNYNGIALDVVLETWHVDVVLVPLLGAELHDHVRHVHTLPA